MTHLLVDASNIIHRSYWIAQKQTDTDNLISFQAQLFLNSLRAYCSRFKPDRIYCVWDKKLTPDVECFRNVICEGTYKGTRNRDAADDVYKAYDLITELIKHLGVINMFPYAMEGDDVIAFLSRKLEGKKVIISGDGDLFQLINENVSIYHVNRKTVITPANFNDNSDVPQIIYTQYKSLIGDKADNIPRIVSPAKAVKVIKGELSLTDEQTKQYERNHAVTCLIDSFKFQPTEKEQLEQQLSESKKESNFKEFVRLCSIHKLDSIVSNQAKWRESFIQPDNLANIAKLLEQYK